MTTDRLNCDWTESRTRGIPDLAASELKAQTLLHNTVNDDYGEEPAKQSFRAQIDNVTSADPKYNLVNVSISGRTTAPISPTVRIISPSRSRTMTRSGGLTPDNNL